METVYVSTGTFSKYMLDLSLTVESVYVSTGTFPKDIVRLRIDRGNCLRVYRHIFEVYVEFESTGTFLGFKLDLKVCFEMCLEIF